MMPSQYRVLMALLAALARVLVPLALSRVLDPPGSGASPKYTMQLGVSLMLLCEWLTFVFLVAVVYALRDIRHGRWHTKVGLIVAIALWLSSAAHSWFIQYPAMIFWIDIDRSLPAQALEPLAR
jgi:hypothetical protein